MTSTPSARFLAMTFSLAISALVFATAIIPATPAGVIV